MRLVVTSDTHNKHESLTYPEGDVFIHCGDITRFGTIFELRKFVNFLSELNFKYKIVIGGNHDFCLSDFRRKKTEKILNDNGVIYLNNSSINIKGVNFWGSPVQPKFFNMAFNKDRGEEIKKYWDLIPEDADVLITHTPPYGILDLTRKGVNVGCEELAKKIQELKIKLSLFGHVHEAQGEIVKDKTLFINTACIVSSTIIEA